MPRSSSPKSAKGSCWMERPFLGSFSAIEMQQDLSNRIESNHTGNVHPRGYEEWRWLENRSKVCLDLPVAFSLPLADSRGSSTRTKHSLWFGGQSRRSRPCPLSAKAPIARRITMSHDDGGFGGRGPSSAGTARPRAATAVRPSPSKWMMTPLDPSLSLPLTHAFAVQVKVTTARGKRNAVSTTSAAAPAVHMFSFGAVDDSQSAPAPSTSSFAAPSDPAPSSSSSSFGSFGGRTEVRISAAPNASALESKTVFIRDFSLSGVAVNQRVLKLRRSACRHRQGGHGFVNATSLGVSSTLQSPHYINTHSLISLA